MLINFNIKYICFFKIDRYYNVKTKKYNLDSNYMVYKSKVNFIKIVNSLLLINVISKSFNLKKSPGIFIIKKRSNAITFTKSPMANKSFSKEQFFRVFYNLFVNFKFYYKKNINKTCFINIIFVLNYLTILISKFQTNLFYLDNSKISILFKYNLFKNNGILNK